MEVSARQSPLVQPKSMRGAAARRQRPVDFGDERVEPVKKLAIHVESASHASAGAPLAKRVALRLVRVRDRVQALRHQLGAHRGRVEVLV